MVHESSTQVPRRNVTFTVALTTPACPRRDQVESEARAAVAQLPGVTDASVRFDARVGFPGSRWRGVHPARPRRLAAQASVLNAGRSKAAPAPIHPEFGPG